MRYGSAALVLFISVKICMVNISYWFYLVKQWKGWQVIEASSLVVENGRSFSTDKRANAATVATSANALAPRV
ncbi:hypothetical protein Tco_0898009 [Tanacetum coccineum]